MKKLTKVLVLLLMLTLSFSAFAVFAFAEGEDVVTEGENTVKPIEIDFDLSRFVDSLQYMWKGMLCIFIVIGVIILSIYGLNKGINYITEMKNNKQQ